MRSGSPAGLGAVDAGGGHIMTVLDISVCLQRRKIGIVGTVNITTGSILIIHIP